MAPLAPEIPTTIFKIGLSRRALFRIQNKIGYICLAWEPAPGYNRKRYIGVSPRYPAVSIGHRPSHGTQTEYYSRDHNGHKRWRTPDRGSSGRASGSTCAIAMWNKPASGSPSCARTTSFSSRSAAYPILRTKAPFPPSTACIRCAPFTGTGLANYSLSYVNGNMTVTPYLLTVTANAQSKIYGAADPALTYTNGALQAGDTSAVFTGGLTRVAGETVAGGPYAINQGTLSAGSNYTISYTGSNLTITPYLLTVTANAQSKVYGAADPALTYRSEERRGGEERR